MQFIFLTTFSGDNEFIHFSIKVSMLPESCLFSFCCFSFINREAYLFCHSASSSWECAEVHCAPYLQIPRSKNLNQNRRDCLSYTLLNDVKDKLPAFALCLFKNKNKTSSPERVCLSQRRRRGQRTFTAVNEAAAPLPRPTCTDLFPWNKG